MAKTIIEPQIEELTGRSRTMGLTYSIYDAARNRNKFLYGIAVFHIRYPNGIEKVLGETPFSTGGDYLKMSLIQSARSLVPKVLQRGIERGLCTANAVISHIDFICYGSLGNDDLKDVKMEYTLGYPYVGPLKGKRGN